MNEKLFVSFIGETLQLNVELFYTSAQVQRFKVAGKVKQMVLEKRLLLKSGQWRILETNFALKKVDEVTVRNLHCLWDAIDEKFNGKTKETYRSPEIRKSEY